MYQRFECVFFKFYFLIVFIRLKIFSQIVTMSMIIKLYFSHNIF
nr:MAG TPA: hypothetical protein [Caudoviricetes sp.]